MATIHFKKPEEKSRKYLKPKWKTRNRWLLFLLVGSLLSNIYLMWGIYG